MRIFQEKCVPPKRFKPTAALVFSKRPSYAERKSLYVPKGTDGTLGLAAHFSHEMNQVIASVQTLWRLRKPTKVHRAVCIEGSNRINARDANYQRAFDLAKQVGQLGYDVVCGAKKDEGINQAARLGALSAGANVIGVRVERQQGKSDSEMTLNHVMRFPHTQKVIKDYFCDAHFFFPGGFGTLDLLFETLCLQQTGKTKKRLMVCFDTDYWQRSLQPFLSAFLDAKTISAEDINLIKFTDSVDEAIALLEARNPRLVPTVDLPERQRGFSPDRNLKFGMNVHQELFYALERFKGYGQCAAIYGSARTRPGDPGYDGTVAQAKAFAEVLGELNRSKEYPKRGIVSGGGPGNMEAANRGAQQGRVPSIGLGIRLPHEQSMNAFIDEGLGYEFDYFLTRKFVFQILASEGVIALSPTGGLGTLDELFEFAWHIQHRLIGAKKILAYDPLHFWEKCIPPILDKMAECGFIRSEDRNLFVIEPDLQKYTDQFAREMGVNRA